MLDVAGGDEAERIPSPSAVEAAPVADRAARREIAPGPEHHHRDVQRGGLRAAVFGVQDGLVSNTLLVLGFAGADGGPVIVRLAGIVGLIAGAVSMASGEYNTMPGQAELFEQELAMERRELRHNPHVEMVELTQIYQSQGIDPDHARELAQSVMQDPEQALEVHAREELGISPSSLGNPLTAALWSFAAFTVGALMLVIAVVLHRGDDRHRGVHRAGHDRGRFRGDGRVQAHPSEPAVPGPTAGGVHPRPGCLHLPARQRHRRARRLRRPPQSDQGA